MATRMDGYDRTRSELFAGLAALYRSRDYSDLVIFGKDGGRHPVHRAVVCPRSPYLAEAVRNRRWRDSNEGHIALPDDDEVVRLIVEYLYLLEYDAQLPTTPTTSATTGVDHNGSDSTSDTMSVRTDANTYGHVYGTSAVSAFGGPTSSHRHNPQHPHQHSQHPHDPSISHISANFRARTDSSLTIHALPTSAPDYAGYNANPGLHHAATIPVRSGRGASGTATLPRSSLGTPGISTSARSSSAGPLPHVRHAPDPSPLATKEPKLALHARMYTAACRYGIEGLRWLALDKFKIQLTRHWDSDELAEAIHIVYNETPSTDKDMREAVADVLGWYGRLLDKPEIEVAIMEINGLAYELLKRSRRVEPEYLD